MNHHIKPCHSHKNIYMLIIYAKSWEQGVQVKLKKRENKGLKRGRKPKDAHLYISESLVKISLWTRQLEESRGKMKSQDREKLRNKISALENRVKKKQVQVQSTELQNSFQDTFNNLTTILVDEVTCSCRDNIITRLRYRNVPPSKDKGPKIDTSHIQLAKTSNKDFTETLTKQITVL